MDTRSSAVKTAVYHKLEDTQDGGRGNKVSVLIPAPSPTCLLLPLSSARTMLLNVQTPLLKRCELC